MTDNVVEQAKQLVLHELDIAEKTILERWRNHVNTTKLKGGPGSGHHGHTGRPGQRGGSTPRGSGVSVIGTLEEQKLVASLFSAVPQDHIMGLQQVIFEDNIEHWAYETSIHGHYLENEIYISRSTPDVEGTLYHELGHHIQASGLLPSNKEFASSGDIDSIVVEVGALREAYWLVGLSRYEGNSVGEQRAGLYRVYASADNEKYLTELSTYAPTHKRIFDELFGSTQKEIYKQLPIDEKSKQNLLNIRLRMFYDESDALTQRMYTGDVTLGDFQEQFKSLIREFHTSAAAIGKGGWDQMGPRDWGRLGTPLREQYKWLQGFVDYVDENRETISYEQIRARARLYGDGAIRAAILIEAGFTIADLLPYLPKDGSSECLNRCHCKWTLQVTGTQGNYRIVRATWILGEADHCKTCISRDGYVEVMRVPIDVEVPSVIGGY